MEYLLKKMKYESHEKFRVIYRNRLVEQLKDLIEKEEQNFFEGQVMLVFHDLLHMHNISCMYQTDECKKELKEWRERFDKIERNLNFYQCAISRTFEQIQILDEEMIPEYLHNELLPLPKYSR